MAASFVQTVTSNTMNLDMTKTFGGARSVAGLATDLFMIIIKMREAEDLGDPEALRNLINFYLDLFNKNCLAQKLDKVAAVEAKYALVALIDETVLSIPGVCRDYWLERPLQIDHFGDSLAGQEFYNKLSRLMANPQNKTEILELYYLCLSLGFEGKFKIGNFEERINIMNAVGAKLGQAASQKGGMISPSGIAKNVDTTTSKKVGLVFFVSVISGTAVFVGWVVCRIISAVSAAATVSHLSTYIK